MIECNDKVFILNLSIIEFIDLVFLLPDPVPSNLPDRVFPPTWSPILILSPQKKSCSPSEKILFPLIPDPPPSATTQLVRSNADTKTVHSPNEITFPMTFLSQNNEPSLDKRALGFGNNWEGTIDNVGNELGLEVRWVWKYRFPNVGNDFVIKPPTCLYSLHPKAKKLPTYPRSFHP